MTFPLQVASITITAQVRGQTSWNVAEAEETADEEVPYEEAPERNIGFGKGYEHGRLEK